MFTPPKAEEELLYSLLYFSYLANGPNLGGNMFYSEWEKYKWQTFPSFCDIM
jgi:hypothetical protein